MGKGRGIDVGTRETGAGREGDVPISPTPSFR